MYTHGRRRWAIANKVQQAEVSSLAHTLLSFPNWKGTKCFIANQWLALILWMKRNESIPRETLAVFCVEKVNATQTQQRIRQNEKKNRMEKSSPKLNCRKESEWVREQYKQRAPTATATVASAPSRTQKYSERILIKFQECHYSFDKWQ